MPLGERIWSSFFQSVTTRTAGFNTADLDKMTDSGKMGMVLLMVIGGSPGSTAGGMKTTTAAVLFAMAISVFRKNEQAHLYNRRIADAAKCRYNFCFIYDAVYRKCDVHQLSGKSTACDGIF